MGKEKKEMNENKGVQKVCGRTPELQKTIWEMMKLKKNERRIQQNKKINQNDHHRFKQVNPKCPKIALPKIMEKIMEETSY